MDEAIGMVFIWIVVAIVVWLIVREIMCWYWKINRAISLLESIDRKLDRLPSGGTPARREEV